MSKKINALFVLFLTSLLLVGCSDANITVKDKDTEFFTVGNQTVKKENVFNSLVKTDAGYTVVSLATKYILDQEVPVTDELRSIADETLETYKVYYGDSLEAAFLSNGFKDMDDFYENNLLATARLDKLNQLYVEANFNDLATTYSPKKASVLVFTSQEAASAAKAALDAGNSVLSVADQFKSSTAGTEELYTSESSLDISILTYILAAKEPAVSEVLSDSTAASYYVVNIVETDAEAMKEEVVSAISKLSDIPTLTTQFYFKKYRLKIYDRTIYDYVQENYAEYLK